MNRVGDMGLSIGFFAIFALFGSIEYATVFSLGSFMNETAITIIGLLLLTGAMAKSAQIPLHSWLPGSMEGQRPFLIYFISLGYVLFLFYFNFSILFYYYEYFIEIIIYITNLFVCGSCGSCGSCGAGFLIIMNTSLLPVHLGRDQKGRFISKDLPLVP
jgi:NADH-ubiquinone oxidoreductase chain 5